MQIEDTSRSEPSYGTRAGEIYAKVIDELLQQERDRKASLEQRGLAVITSSGVLTTLAFGFAAIVKSAGGPALPIVTRLSLLAALVCFLAAALLSLRINQPIDYSPLGVKKGLKRMLTDELWDEPAEVGIKTIALFRTEEIDRWRTSNGTKARQLYMAIAAESAGVGLLVVSVAVLLFRGYPAA
jgi:hypothetical protein